MVRPNHMEYYTLDWDTHRPCMIVDGKKVTPILRGPISLGSGFALVGEMEIDISYIDFDINNINPDYIDHMSRIIDHKIKKISNLEYDFMVTDLKSAIKFAYQNKINIDIKKLTANFAGIEILLPSNVVKLMAKSNNICEYLYCIADNIIRIIKEKPNIVVVKPVVKRTTHAADCKFAIT